MIRPTLSYFRPAFFLCLAGASLYLAAASSGADAREVATQAQLGDTVNAALRPGLTGEARVAVRVVDADTGEVLLETPNADAAFTPASNMKLVTSATALDLYGPGHKLTTTVRMIGDDLWIIGAGDPALGDPNLEKDRGRTAMSVLEDWADAVQERGITEVPGQVVVCDLVFDDELTHPSWHPANLLHWYGAPVAGVSFNDNCVDFTFVPTEVGQSATVELMPPAGGFEVRGTVLTSGDKHDPKLDKRRNADPPVYAIEGHVTNQTGPYSKPVNDPRRFLGEAFKAVLIERGVEVTGDVRVTNQEAPPATETPAIATHVTPMFDVLGRVNTNSQNMMAEALAKLNGLAYDTEQGVESPRGSWGSGHLAAAAFLKGAGIDTSVLVAADGSGLSRENRVSAELLTDLLLHMLREHDRGKYFVGSMAISGVRGSVRKRMDDLKGKVYAKTGTISGVSALSGYVFHDSGRILVFSILHNGFEGSQTPYRGQQDDAVRAMWSWLDAQPAVEVVEEKRPAAMAEVLELVAP